MLELANEKREDKEVKRLKIAFDVDDTIINFTEHILRSLGLDPYGKVEWGFKNYSEDIREKVFKMFVDEEFIRNAPISNKLKESIDELSKKHDIFFVTATYPEAATERILYLKRHFPNVDPENIIIAGNKSIFNFDIFFDDRFSNLSGDSTNNILVNRHWNKGATRFPIVRSLNDMLEVIDMIESGNSKNEIFKRFKSKNITKDSIVLIQGHTGSGKNFLLNHYLNGENKANLSKIRTTTTRAMREGEDNSSYNFITKEEFKRKIANDEFIEHTIYSGNFYGTEKKALEDIYNKGLRPVIIVDSEGIESFNDYTNNLIDIYIKRDVKTTVEGLLRRDNSLDRLNKLAEELKILDQHKCRCSIVNTGDVEETLRVFESCII